MDTENNFTINIFLEKESSSYANGNLSSLFLFIANNLYLLQVLMKQVFKIDIWKNT